MKIARLAAAAATCALIQAGAASALTTPVGSPSAASAVGADAAGAVGAGTGAVGAGAGAVGAGAGAVGAGAGAVGAGAGAVGAGAGALGARDLIRRASQVTVRNDTERSTNWSGYAVQTKTWRKFTNVVGTWVQPRATCLRAGSRYAAFWVGLDGYASSSVEQVGTDSDCQGRAASYYAWWEMYPAGPVQLSARRYPVKPGDTLTAGVLVKNRRFVLTLKSSEGWKFIEVKPAIPSYTQSSAEWVAEAPLINGTVAKLAQFSGFAFSKAYAATNSGTDSPISSFTSRQPHEIDMFTVAGFAKATTSALLPKGHAFAIWWDRA